MYNNYPETQHQRKWDYVLWFIRAISETSRTEADFASYALFVLPKWSNQSSRFCERYLLCCFDRSALRLWLRTAEAAAALATGCVFYVFFVYQNWFWRHRNCAVYNTSPTHDCGMSRHCAKLFEFNGCWVITMRIYIFSVMSTSRYSSVNLDSTRPSMEKARQSTLETRHLGE